MGLRQEKVASLIRDIASSFLKDKIEKGSVLTITKVEISPDLKSSVIFVAIFPEKNEEKIVAKIDAKELRQFARKYMKLKFLPHFEIKIDEGEKKRGRIDELLRQN